MIRDAETAWALLERALDKHPLLVMRAAYRIVYRSGLRKHAALDLYTAARARLMYRLYLPLFNAGLSFDTAPHERDARLYQAAKLFPLIESVRGTAWAITKLRELRERSR